MRVRDLVYESTSSFGANKFRSFLTVLGIVIGIGAVIAMTALIGGIKQSLMGELGLGQARLVYISVYPGREVTTDDVKAIASGMPEYEYVVPVTYGGTSVSSETKQADGSVQGVTADYYSAMELSFVAGRAATAAEDDSSARVVVIDQNTVRTLFGNDTDAGEVVGKTLKVGNDAYEVIGVIESGSLYQSDFVQLYIPFSTTAARITGYSNVDQILGVAREGVDMDAIVPRTEEYLRAYFNLSQEDAGDSMYVMTMQSVIDEVNATMLSFQLLMTAVASISLVVGGIGIMNMMLTNVTERIREIGLRKALGARRRDITMQFLLESVFLCMIGGVFGLVFGYLGALGLSGLAGDILFEGAGQGGAVTPVIDGSTVLLATGICVGIGLVFGIYPAWRAARLDPVESLHYQ